MSKTIRAGLGGDFDAPQVAFGVRTPVRIKPGDPEFEHMLEFEGKVYVTAARIQELTGWTYINVMTYASRDMWPRINHPKGGRFKMYALDAAMATHHSVKLHLKTVQRAA
ncbi:hypothetical protein [Bradyrhizobium sp.]|uniref:hypothetical protein n=1 Tax=Bradyrhizobium sp. TaxID=376 RepID=UPI0027324B85|nr:hypothetical protein [Bradyrhizobium sp.]